MLETVAWGRVDAGGNLINGRGATVSRVSAGKYKIALSDEIGQTDDTEMMITLQPYDVTAGIVPMVRNSGDLVKDVWFYITISGALSDTHFFFKIERLKIL